MTTVDQYNYIRTAHRVYGKKIREIVRDTGHSRNTVRKALSQATGFGVNSGRLIRAPSVRPQKLTSTSGIKRNTNSETL